MATYDEGFSRDRTQEVAGSSPASSMKDLQMQIFCFLDWIRRGPGIRGGQSEEDARRFLSERSAPLEAVGFAGRRPQPQFWPVHNYTLSKRCRQVGAGPLDAIESAVTRRTACCPSGERRAGCRGRCWGTTRRRRGNALAPLRRHGLRRRRRPALEVEFAAPRSVSTRGPRALHGRDQARTHPIQRRPTAGYA
jgi:hypothetical protein